MPHSASACPAFRHQAQNLEHHIGADQCSPAALVKGWRHFHNIGTDNLKAAQAAQ